VRAGGGGGRRLCIGRVVACLTAVIDGNVSGRVLHKAVVRRRHRVEWWAHTAVPEVGRRWTDSGEIREARDLNGRPGENVLPVPCHPVLTAILRERIAAGRLMRATCCSEGSGRAGSPQRCFGRVGQDPAGGLHISPSRRAGGKGMYGLRYICLITWLNDGVSLAQVAGWAGNGVLVLLATCAGCLSGPLSAFGGGRTGCRRGGLPRRALRSRPRGTSGRPRHRGLELDTAGALRSRRLVRSGLRRAAERAC
jgi:hypothetical protein